MSDASVPVLLVDDEEPFRRALTRRLGHRGFTVTEAADGPTALAMLTAQPRQVVVLDVKMPGMDGLSLLDKIQKLGLVTPVILLSGHADLDACAQGICAGALDYLLKPVDIEELAARIADAAVQLSLRTGPNP